MASQGDYTDFGKEVLERLQTFNSAPVLFVGSGISRRYLGLPGWEDLLKDLASKTDRTYAYYRANANSDMAEIASLLAEPINEKVWSDAAYEQLRAENEEHLLLKDSALKVLAAQSVKELRQIDDTDLSEEVELLKEAVVDAIITTNYDKFLEGLFPEYQVYVGQDELIFSDPRGVGEIYKIHGSVDDPNSIVLTTQDYGAYNERNAYLAAKLLTLFVEHPVIFLGYSMSDSNITKLLENLVSCLKPEHVSKLQNRLLFVHRSREGVSRIANTVIPIQGTNLPVVDIEVKDYKELFKALGVLKRRFPARTLRRLKDHIYELVLTNDPKGKLHVMNIDEAGEEDRPDVVIGVGAMTKLGRYGYKRITRTDLILDVLEGSGEYDAERILKDTVPEFLAGGNVPFVKYMAEAGFISQEGTLIRGDELDERLVRRFSSGAKPLLATKSTQRYARQLAERSGTFTQLVQDTDYKHVLIGLQGLPHDKVSPEELRAFLVTHKDEAITDGKCDTNFAKAVGLLERLECLSAPW